MDPTNETYQNFNFTFDAHDVDCPKYSPPVFHLCVIVLLGLICLLGLIGNIILITVVARLPLLQNATNSYMYIMHVAVADCLFLLGVPILMATMVLGSWPFEMIMCKVYMMMTSLSQFSKPIFLLLMIVDCYIEICRPISSVKYCTPSMSKVVCIVVWLGSAIMMMPITMYSNVIVSECEVSCNIIWVEIKGENGLKTFTFLCLFLDFVLPLVLILVFSMLGTRRLQYLCCHNEEYLLRMIKLVLTLGCAYLVCWFPYWLGQLIIIYPETLYYQLDPEIIVVIYLSIYLLSYLNAAINPVLFVKRSEKIKKNLMKIYWSQ